MGEDNIVQGQIAKKAAGFAAVNLIEEGMLVGLGTGSTAAYFIEALSQKCKEGFTIKAIATSLQSEKLAIDGKIPLLDSKSVSYLDITVDGADEITKKKEIIKGGGGALLREKIVASMSKKVVIIVDQKKVVEKLGSFPLPVEVISFGIEATIKHINDKGFFGELRLDKNKALYVTDNGNYIYDIHFPNFINDPKKVDYELKTIVGVVETGLFIDIASQVIVGCDNGETYVF